MIFRFITFTFTFIYASCIVQNVNAQSDIAKMQSYILNNWQAKNISDCSDLDIDFIDDEENWIYACDDEKAAYCRPYFSIRDEGNIVYFNSFAIDKLSAFYDNTEVSIPTQEDWSIFQNKLYNLPNQPGCHFMSSTSKNKCSHSRNGIHKYCSPDLLSVFSIMNSSYDDCTPGFLYMKDDEIRFIQGKIRFWCSSTEFYSEFNLKNGSMKLKENVVNSNSDKSVDLYYAGYPLILKKN